MCLTLNPGALFTTHLTTFAVYLKLNHFENVSWYIDMTLTYDTCYSNWLKVEMYHYDDRNAWLCLRCGLKLCVFIKHRKLF